MHKNQVNEQGETLAEFLKGYTPGHYERPSVTVDIAVFTTEGETLLIRRRNHPNIYCWALPGGFLEMKETLYESALRELEEETGVTGVPLQSIGMFGEPTRDPRTRILTAAFAAMTPREKLRIQAGDDAADARLFRWECEVVGRVNIPTYREAADKTSLVLPCTACGEELTEEGTGYRVRLTNGDICVSALLAVDDAGVSALLRTPACESDEVFAGDHALIFFSALRRLALIA